VTERARPECGAGADVRQVSRMGGGTLVLVMTTRVIA
jgi:hypothetical protein